MGADFCVWCGICVKYLVFGTYPTSTVGALIIIIIIIIRRRRRRITEITKLKYEKRNREGERVWLPVILKNEDEKEKRYKVIHSFVQLDRTSSL